MVIQLFRFLIIEPSRLWLTVGYSPHCGWLCALS